MCHDQTKEHRSFRQHLASTKSWRLLLDKNKVDLLADLHTEADFGEGCCPVRWQLGLLCVKPSPPFCNMEGCLVAPKAGIVVKGWLCKIKNRKKNPISCKVCNKNNNPNGKNCLLSQRVGG